MLSFKSKITITAKRIKYLVINLPKEAKDLYLESYETLMKEIKDSQIERYTMFLDWKNQHCESVYYSKQSTHSMQSLSDYQWHSSQSLDKNFTIYMETQKTPKR